MDRRDFLINMAQSSVIVFSTGMIFDLAAANETRKSQHHLIQRTNLPPMRPGSCKDFSRLEREPKIFV